MTKKLKQIKTRLIQFVIIQLLITLISLPILIYSGIPISKMSVIGNLIFTPFLAVFITLSSIVFFAELFNIPNLFFIKLLEQLTIFWDKLLSLGQKSWLMGFKDVHMLILLTIPVVVYFIVKDDRLNNLNKKLTGTTCALLFYIFIFSYSFFSTNNISPTYLLDNKLEINHQNGIINLKDNGAFNRKKSIRTYLDFELKPYLIKNFGTIKIENLSVLKPGISSFKAAQEICKVFELQDFTKNEKSLGFY